MTRGKYAAKTAGHRIAELEQRTADLEREVQRLTTEAKEREHAHQDELQRERGATSRRVVEYVQQQYADKIEASTDGLSAAAWVAQRLAVTEHLAWLFLKGYVHWDRLEGDREVLQFITTHGNLRAWWILMDKYGWRSNHADRRVAQRWTNEDAIRKLLYVLDTVEKARGGDDKARADREALDAVVDRARDAFMDVDLEDLLTVEGFTPTVTDEDRLIHAYVAANMADFGRYAERLS